jgi:hypothetical protein
MALPDTDFFKRICAENEEDVPLQLRNRSDSLENANNSLRGLIARDCRGRVVLQSSMPKYSATYPERSVIHVSRALVGYTDITSK